MQVGSSTVRMSGFERDLMTSPRRSKRGEALIRLRRRMACILASEWKRGPRAFEGRYRRILRTAAPYALPLVIVCSPVIASAIGEPEPAQQVSIEITAVRAVQNLRGGSGDSKKREVGPDLASLSRRLKKLPYRQFHLLSKNEFVVPVNRRFQLRIGPGHRLTMNPISVTPEGIAIWLRWKDDAGEKVLDSRLRVQPGETILTGTDHTKESGLILAIRILPVPLDS